MQEVKKLEILNLCKEYEDEDSVIKNISLTTDISSDGGRYIETLFSKLTVIRKALISCMSAVFFYPTLTKLIMGAYNGKDITLLTGMLIIALVVICIIYCSENAVNYLKKDFLAELIKVKEKKLLHDRAAYEQGRFTYVNKDEYETMLRLREFTLGLFRNEEENAGIEYTDSFIAALVSVSVAYQSEKIRLYSAQSGSSDSGGCGSCGGCSGCGGCGGCGD